MKVRDREKERGNMHPRLGQVKEEQPAGMYVNQYEVG